MLFEDWLQPTGRPGQTEPWDWGSLPGTRCPSYVPPDPGAAVPAVLEHLPSFLSLSPSLSLCSSFYPLVEVGVGEEEQGQNPQLCSMHSLVAESRKHTAGTGCWSRRGMWRNPATHITPWTPNPHNLMVTSNLRNLQSTNFRTTLFVPENVCESRTTDVYVIWGLRSQCLKVYRNPHLWATNKTVVVPEFNQG